MLQIGYIVIVVAYLFLFSSFYIYIWQQLVSEQRSMYEWEVEFSWLWQNNWKKSEEDFFVAKIKKKL